MKKFAYGSVIIIPVLLNILMEIFNFKTVLSDWYITSIIVLATTNLILLYEFIHARKLLSNAFEIDKKKVSLLLKKLDINTFQGDIVEVDSWHGYRQDAITKIIDFLDNATLLQLKTSDKKLNKLINDFVIQLDEFSTYTARHVVSGKNHFVPIARVETDYETRKEETEKMNKLAGIAYQKLERLMEYIRKKNYID
jgi:hypothetical protein